MHNCNWKMFIENLNDTMHPMVTHESAAGTAKQLWAGQPEDAPKPVAVEQFLPFVSEYKFFEDMGVRVFENGHSYSGVHFSIHSKYSSVPGYEEAMKANPRPDPRHRIEHATLTKPHATQKAADLGVQISCQPQFLRFSTNLESQLGAERAGRIKVTREWLDAGINVALGSDTPTAPWHEPHVTLVGAVARLGPNDQPVHPEQAMTIQEALYAHTMGSAKAAFEENIKGSLTPGKYADLVVWSQNFYDIDLVNDYMEMENVVAEITMIEGQVVHEAETA